jgi:phage tail-like protein
MEKETTDRLGTTSRARFLGGAAGLTGLAVAGGVFTKEASAAPARKSAGPKRAYVGGNFALSLDGGKNIGMLKAAQGGQIYGEPVAEPSGGATYQKKHIGNVKYADITMQMGIGMPTAFYQWIADSWNNGATRKNGAIILADQNFNAIRELDFTQALISEVGFPALDASSKDAAYMTLKLAPQSTVNGKPRGTLSSIGGTKQKAWLVSNFRLQLGSLDTQGVSKIDSFTIKQSMAQPSTDVGDVSELDPVLVVSVPAYNVDPGVVDFPNLRVTLTEASAATWMAWYEDFIRNGNNSDDYEKNGSISFLEPSNKTELGRIDLFNVGIFNLTDERPFDPAADQIRRFVAELYVERMQFAFPGVRNGGA